MEVYFEHADGTFWITRTDGLEAARDIVANEMIAIKENCSAEENSDIFPVFWSIKNKSGEIVASGYLGTSGEVYN